MEYGTGEIVGLFCSAFLTLCVFSFLFGDNPFYKFAEHVYVGVSAGYWMCSIYWSTIYVEIYEPLTKQDWLALIPLTLGILLLFQIHPKTAWISRWPLAFLVGMYAGLNIVLTMDAQIITQLSASIQPLWDSDLKYWEIAVNWITVFGLLTGMIYFYFSVPHKGIVFGGGARIGIWVLMIALGASFGSTVMARVSLLVGRMQFFSDEFWPMFQNVVLGVSGG